MIEKYAADTYWQDLANAIIVQAAKDYRRTMKMLRENSQNIQFRIDRQRLEGFFRSDWFPLLTNLDGRQLLNDLQKEAAQ